MSILKPEPTHIVALSGGKDSTAMALRLKEVYPDRKFEYICTPTGNELPEMIDHWNKLECILEQPIKRITNGTLESWINGLNAIPNWRHRWCTVNLKIKPCLAYIKSFLVKPHLYVGLRADEPERKGIYSEDVHTIFPLRDWGWDIHAVQGYLREKGIKLPRRTDCAWCFYQRIGEWFLLWRDNRDLWDRAVAYEEKVGHTFRNPNHPNWGRNLREMAELFANGKRPRKEWDSFNTLEFFGDEDAEDEMQFASCRVCRL